MGIISKPPRLTPIASQEIDLMRLSLDEISPKQLVDKYSWMSVYNFEDLPRTEEFYINEAKKFIGTDVKSKIREIKRDIEDNEKEYEKIISKINDKLLLAQTELLHRSGYIRDMREEVRDRLTILEKELYEKLANTCNLTLEQVVYLTTDEIKEAIKTKKSFKKEANERRKSYIFVGHNDKVKIVKDLDVNSLLNQYRINEVAGKSAFISEKVIGTARIVLNNSQVNKVKEGDILIAGMTKPDYMPAIKKAKALVTDEGGLTCHAAIVARELKKPCIIGTKIATLVFKDGDTVEVDSNTGVVKLIK
jgi:phosphoenolpyruvate synthase/pyruvate phosphate dikinase